MNNSPSLPSRPSSWLRKKLRFLSVMSASKSSSTYRWSLYQTMRGKVTRQLTMMHGAISRALSKTSTIDASSPLWCRKDLTYSGAKPCSMHTFMMALTVMVLPLPGGPWMIIPRYISSAYHFRRSTGRAMADLPWHGQVFVEVLAAEETLHVVHDVFFELVFEDDLFPPRFLDLNPELVALLPVSIIEEEELLMQLYLPRPRSCK